MMEPPSAAAAAGSATGTWRRRRSGTATAAAEAVIASVCGRARAALTQLSLRSVPARCTDQPRGAATLDGTPPHSVSGAVRQATLSVVVPAYNEERRLPALLSVLDSAAERVFGPAALTLKEVVVVDDGSTDGTRRLLESYGGLEG